MGARALALLLMVSLGAAEAIADRWTAPRAITTVDLSADVLDALGLQVLRVPGGASSSQFPGFAFETSEPGSLLEFYAPGGDFERLDRGALRHTGGFVLQLPGEAAPVSLEGFELHVAAAPDDFDWRDAGGFRFFVLRHMQFTTSLADQELRLLNVSIHVSPELARRLGRAELSGSYVGTANIRLPALIPPDLAGGAGAGPSCEDTEGPIDVALTDLSFVSQIAREAGVRVALAPSAALANVGVGSVDWYESIDPVRFDGVGPHPFLSLSMYRLDPDGSVAQLGLGDVKHAFRALNSGCPCPSAALLHPGCSDVYGVSTNENRRYLAPREEVTAFTGAWDRVGSHFDRCLAVEANPFCDPASDDADDYRDHDGDSSFYHDSFEHRLVVSEVALEQEDARYFVEAWYLVAGDVDLWNSVGRIEVVPDLDDDFWTFESVGTMANGSVLDAIPDATRSTIDTGEGRLQLAARTTDLGGGEYRYDYTLMNFDFGRRIERFTVPLAPGMQVMRADSRATGDEESGDWMVAVDDEQIVWQAPADSPLDWGMLTSFRFEVDAAPVDGQVQLGVRDPGGPDPLRVAVVTPVPEPGASTLAGVGLGAIGWLRRYGRRSRLHLRPSCGGNQ